jgi:tRNA modification GTPase
MKNSTIAAISTPAGSGGIGIIKISGPDALQIGGSIFKKRKNASPKVMPPREVSNGFRSHFLYHGHILDDGQDRVIDEVLFTYMQGPSSYTGEDVVEIQAHSGRVVLTAIIDMVLKRGAILAGPGEFTRRAFLNGRIDLSQAEAVIDLIQAKSINSLKIAASHIKGDLKNEILNIRKTLFSILTTIEAVIDFPDEVEALIDPHKDLSLIEHEVLFPLVRLIGQFESGQFLREGVSMAIVGRPNVGKSSLMNRLLKKDRAIVTAFPGTTRDTIEEFINIEGIPALIADTAGIQDTSDPIEKMGIKRTKEKLGKAQLILFMTDATNAFIRTELDILERIPKGKLIFVVNKADLLTNRRPPMVSGYNDIPCVFTSALYNKGITQLMDVIKDKILNTFNYEDNQTVVPNLRQKIAIEQAVNSLRHVLKGIKEQIPMELIAIDLRESIEKLGEVIGESLKGDVLDQIFEQFCIGK